MSDLRHLLSSAMALHHTQDGHGGADIIAGMVGVMFGFREAGADRHVLEVSGCREGMTIAEMAGAIVAVTGDNCSRREAKRGPVRFALCLLSARANQR